MHSDRILLKDQLDSPPRPAASGRAAAQSGTTPGYIRCCTGPANAAALIAGVLTAASSSAAGAEPDAAVYAERAGPVLGQVSADETQTAYTAPPAEDWGTERDSGRRTVVRTGAHWVAED